MEKGSLVFSPVPGLDCKTLADACFKAPVRKDRHPKECTSGTQGPIVGGTTGQHLICGWVRWLVAYRQ